MPNCEGISQGNFAWGPSIGDLRQAGQKDAHHIIQDAAVKYLPGYDTHAAPGVQLPGPANIPGTPHYYATQVQRQGGGGTYAAERRIGYKALRRGGLRLEEARAAIARADVYFAQYRGPTSYAHAYAGESSAVKEVAMGKEKIALTTKHIVKLLVAGEYTRIERLTKARRLTAVHLREAVAAYGRRLKMPPDTVFEHLDVIAVAGVSPQRWSVRCDLWTEEEGCSDLSLELTLIETDNTLLTTEVDNLHVL